MSTELIKKWTEQLNGREYREELRRGDADALKAAGLVVCFGASDDLVVFHGAIDDELGVWEGGDVYLYRVGIFSPEDATAEWGSRGVAKIAAQCAKVTAVWCPQDVKASWAYRTEIPHATFDVMEDGDVYCRGIVFHIDSLPVLPDLEPTNA